MAARSRPGVKERCLKLGSKACSSPWISTPTLTCSMSSSAASSPGQAPPAARPGRTRCHGLRAAPRVRPFGCPKWGSDGSGRGHDGTSGPSRREAQGRARRCGPRRWRPASVAGVLARSAWTGRAGAHHRAALAPGSASRDLPGPHGSVPRAGSRPGSRRLAVGGWSAKRTLPASACGAGRPARARAAGKVSRMASMQCRGPDDPKVPACQASAGPASKLFSKKAGIEQGTISTSHHPRTHSGLAYALGQATTAKCAVQE